MTAAALAAILAVSPGPEPAPCVPSKEAAVSVENEERAVRAALAAFLDAVNRQDFAAVVDMLTDDAVFWTADYPALEGKAAVRAAYAALTGYRVHQISAWKSFAYAATGHSRAATKTSRSSRRTEKARGST